MLFYYVQTNLEGSKEQLTIIKKQLDEDFSDKLLENGVHTINVEEKLYKSILWSENSEILESIIKKTEDMLINHDVEYILDEISDKILEYDFLDKKSLYYDLWVEDPDLFHRYLKLNLNVDYILDKIKKFGIESLEDYEKDILNHSQE